MRLEQIKSVALALTLGVHFAIIGGVWWTAGFEATRFEKRASIAEENFQHIEAGLAVKAKSTKGRKTKQPQKDVAHKVSPTDVAVSKDDQAKPQDKKKDDKDKTDEIDPESVFAKHRTGAEGKPPEDQAAAEPGADEENKEGQVNGSEYGRLEQAKGDPYVGELVGRMTVNPEFVVPSVVPDDPKVETLGCVKLAPDGKVANFQLDPDHKSASATFNSAVLRRLRETTDMEQPVPDNLRNMLVENWACVSYHN